MQCIKMTAYKLARLIFYIYRCDSSDATSYSDIATPYPLHTTYLEHSSYIPIQSLVGPPKVSLLWKSSVSSLKFSED